MSITQLRLASRALLTATLMLPSMGIANIVPPPNPPPSSAPTPQISITNVVGPPSISGAVSGSGRYSCPVATTAVLVFCTLQNTEQSIQINATFVGGFWSCKIPIGGDISGAVTYTATVECTGLFGSGNTVSTLSQSATWEEPGNSF